MGQNKADKIFYLTSKTITRTVAENTYVLLRENGLHFRTVTLTARDKICMAEKENVIRQTVSMPKDILTV